MSLLELHNVSKVYGEGAGQVAALDQVSLEVDRGSLVAVMGPSGSGKSTLLTIAGTLEDASEGRVIIDGHDQSRLSRNDKARLRRRTIGFVQTSAGRGRPAHIADQVDAVWGRQLGRVEGDADDPVDGRVHLGDLGHHLGQQLAGRRGHGVAGAELGDQVGHVLVTDTELGTISTQV